MPEYITTYGGTHFYPTAPQAQDVHITDVAHALSLICRGNGHVKTFFSVGHHCILCAKEALARDYGPRIAMACLLHDAGECYMSDVPRPFKKEMPHYQELEAQLLDLIYTKYLGSSLTEEEAEALKEIDDDLLYFDLTELLGEPASSPPPTVHVDICYGALSFSEVEAEYLRLYSQLKEMLSAAKQTV